METPEQPSKAPLWIGAAITAAAAIFFPRIQGIRDEGESWWRLVIFLVPQDTEGLVLVPLVILLTLGLFAVVGRRAWRGNSAGNRPAKAGLVSSVLGILGVVAFFLSAPIVLGGLGVTLGIEGRRRARAAGGTKLAIAAIAVGALAVAEGAAIWVFGEELGI
ncbi:MAG TPA: hypothetical protein VKB10_08720 [Gaiellaceae bacterium]|nr:hypothetical protein [Gaiellaceae bacterium]